MTTRSAAGKLNWGSDSTPKTTEAAVGGVDGVADTRLHGSPKTTPPAHGGGNCGGSRRRRT